MKHQPEIVIHSNCDPFADSPQFAHNAPLYIRNARFNRAKQKRARQPHPLERLVQYARLQRRKIGGDVWQFWHFLSACMLDYEFRNSVVPFII